MPSHSVSAAHRWPSLSAWILSHSDTLHHCFCDLSSPLPHPHPYLTLSTGHTSHRQCSSPFLVTPSHLPTMRVSTYMLAALPLLALALTTVSPLSFPDCTAKPLQGTPVCDPSLPYLTRAQVRNPPTPFSLPPSTLPSHTALTPFPSHCPLCLCSPSSVS